MDNYQFRHKIGEGTYENVVKAKVRETGQIVAIKKSHVDITEEGFPTSSFREITTLNMLSHCKHIIKYEYISNFHMVVHIAPFLFYQSITDDVLKC